MGSEQPRSGVASLNEAFDVGAAVRFEQLDDER